MDDDFFLLNNVITNQIMWNIFEHFSDQDISIDIESSEKGTCIKGQTYGIDPQNPTTKMFTDGGCRGFFKIGNTPLVSCKHTEGTPRRFCTIQASQAAIDSGAMKVVEQQKAQQQPVAAPAQPVAAPVAVQPVAAQPVAAQPVAVQPVTRPTQPVAAPAQPVTRPATATPAPKPSSNNSTGLYLTIGGISSSSCCCFIIIIIIVIFMMMSKKK